MKIVPVAAAFTLTLGALTGGPPLPAAAEDAAGGAAAPARAAPTLSWHACSDGALYGSGAQCTTLSVPLNYKHPGGRHITLALSRIRHTSSAAQYQGVMLVNPGGPGGAGLDMSTLGSAVPKNAGDYYDWIGFDPRGVGSSRPSLSCIPNYFHFDRPDYRPRTTKLIRAWKHRSRNYADACNDKYPRLLRHMTTADTARDMNRIRQALGVTRISFYGFSYGTYLGQVYATLFPTHLRRMVLDSNVDKRRVWYGANLDQDGAFDRNIDIWFRWVAKYADVYHLGQTRAAVSKNWYGALHDLAAHPAGGRLGPAEWTDTFLWAGYYRSTWVSLAHAFSRYVHGGHWRPAARFYAAYNSPYDDNGYAGYLAVECTDAPWPQRWSRWKSDSERIAADAPFLTWANTWFNAPCLYWHAGARQPVDIKGGGADSVLLIDEKLDAATPYEGSIETRRLFPNSSLIAEPGGMTHADSLSGNDCVDDWIARYLATGDRPPRKDGDQADFLCDPLPDPVPPGA